ncbi:hypothetical protein DRP04_11540 [Archaeoglobales archaeon]|nr:MAG: hypothetical protein DRP04_11540 [Archaeoglobales archaeon]
MTSEPQPLDPKRYGYWNAYMIPLKEHASTHYLEITISDKLLNQLFRALGEIRLFEQLYLPLESVLVIVNIDGGH